MKESVKDFLIVWSLRLHISLLLISPLIMVVGWFLQYFKITAGTILYSIGEGIFSISLFIFVLILLIDSIRTRPNSENKSKKEEPKKEKSKKVGEKLVRDNIPLQYDLPYRYTRDKKEYRRFLQDKLLEEAKEVIEASSKINEYPTSKNKLYLEEEFADILEVLDTMLKEYEIDIQEVHTFQRAKASVKGKFSAGRIIEVNPKKEE